MPTKNANRPRRIVDAQGLADYLGLSIHTVRRDRHGARRFPYIKLGPELYRYDLDRIDEVLTTCEVGGSGSAAAAA
ncbi:MAG: hypothetical protein KF863_10360 [Rubrivivax sp.]|nr:hypothetical protein [Rubrivivax sp.]